MRILIGPLALAAALFAAETAQGLFQKALAKERAEADLKGAIALYERVVKEFSRDRKLAAEALYRIGECHQVLGSAEAKRAWERLVREFGDQADVAAKARARLVALKSAEPTTITIRRVWAGPDVNLLGAPSPDGAYLTFQDQESQGLALHDLATGEKRLLAKPRSVWEFVMHSVPAPDGKKVAYCSYNTDKFYDLRVAGLDGSEPRVLYRNPEVAWLYVTDWSPDGKSILAVLNLRDGSNQMVLVSAADGAARVLKSFGRRSPGRARFSPDGRYIVYATAPQPASEEHDIFLYAMDGGREIPLVQHPANDTALDWTPDGKRILFGSNRTGRMGVWSIQVADGQPRGNPELIKPDLAGVPLGFTRKGSYYYGVGTGKSDVYIAELDLGTGKLLRPPAPATERFVGSNSGPDWSADGRQLLFLSNRGGGAWGARALCVRSTESGEVRELVSKLDRVSWVRWSPDAQSLLANGRTSLGFGIYRIDVRKGEYSTVVGEDEPKLGWPGVWSRDGKAIFYHRLDPAAKKSLLVRRDLESGQDKEIHSVSDPSHYRGGAALSPDGQELAFGVGDTESQSLILKVAPAKGGQAREVWRGPTGLSPRPIEWAPDGRSLLITRRRGPADPQTDLWLIPVQGGAPRKLELAAEDLRDIAIHPDGRRIAFTAGQDRSEVWALENLLSK
ncbi:MAG: hypothetical protein AAB225_29640 [Acidobacteriota bacterium]